MKIENFIEGRLGTQGYNFSIDKRVDAQVELCDVNRPVTLTLLTDGTSRIGKAQTGNSNCRDIDTTFPPGIYRLEVSAARRDASRYSIKMGLADR
jgi:hypothetical protein